MKPPDLSDFALEVLFTQARKTMELGQAIRHVLNEVDRLRCAGLRPEVVAIANEVAARFNTTRAILLGRESKKALKRARVMAWWLLHFRYDLSYPTIGRAFGGRHHTTILLLTRAFAALVERDPRLRRLLDEVEAAAWGEMQRRAA